MNGGSGKPNGPSGGGPRKPTPMRGDRGDRGDSPDRPRRRIGWAWLFSGLVLALILIPSLLADAITDWMWFDSQSLGGVYSTRLWLFLGVLAGSWLLATVFFWVNWTWARRASRTNTVYPGQRESLPESIGRIIILAVAIAAGLGMALIAADEWPTILLFVNSVPFGQTDPIFNNDVGFYVFGLPLYKFVLGWALGALIVTAIGAGVIYSINSGLQQFLQQLSEAQAASGTGRTAQRPNMPTFQFKLDKRIETHLSILGAVFLLLLAVGYWFSQYDILYSSRAVAYGAGYADVNAKLPAQYILMAVAAAAWLLLLVNVWVRTWKILLGAFALWVAALILAGGVYPAVIQSFVVKPSELDKETPYILNNIAATRKAFGLENFNEREVPAVTTITRDQLGEDAVNANGEAGSDIRLWDYRLLLETFGQLQEIRSYYAFSNVDIDRYQIDGKSKQVMIAARELRTDELPEIAKTWQNEHFVYTHGYGAVVSSVSDIEGEGLPKLLLKNVPPETDIPAFEMTRPEIYYGELTDNYVFVNSGQMEFDYPLGDANQLTKYQGKGGVALSNFFTKLLFAIRFGDGNVMLSPEITPETRVLFHRNINDAVNLLAPFLEYDDDPYIVISEGKLYWIQDAYTVSDRYPYSSPYFDSFNYIRNSVKVVISAYDGSATFYINDPTDPIAKAYRGIFPALFKDIADMPADLRSHIRYPEGLMNVQAGMYETFHMTEPQVFYSREDMWKVPFGTRIDTTESLEAYYVMMGLPGDTDNSFRLILPFTPSGKSNMIAWMAAASDGEDYGRVDVIRYPKQQLVYGPDQIEARIDQDPVISQQITLWSQSGSQVRRGNLVIIPISNSVIYVEPLFLQATSSKFPELKRVIIATGDRVGMGSDLASALDAAFGGPALPPTVGNGANPTPLPGRTPLPGTTPIVRNAAAITQSMQDHYDRAQNALRQADLSTYERELQALKRDLDELALVTGAP